MQLNWGNVQLNEWVHYDLKKGSFKINKDLITEINILQSKHVPNDKSCWREAFRAFHAHKDVVASSGNMTYSSV